MGQATDPTAVVADASDLSANTVIPIRATNRGSLRVAQTEPALAALARNRFCFSPGVVANASAPVAEMPTTAAAMALYNPSSSGKSYFIESVWAHSASGTLGLGAALIAGLPSIDQAAAVANGTGVVGPARLGGGSETCVATFAAAVTLSGAPAWITLAGAQQVAAVSVGATIIARVDGMIEVAPGKILGLNVLAPTGTSAKFSFGIVFSQYRYTAYA